jgi:hypothetical protein
VLSDIIEILKLAGAGAKSLFGARAANREGSWQEVIIALDMLTELSTLHVKAINEVTAPLLSSGDLVETSRRYYQLVNNPDFPQGYGAIRGILSSAKHLAGFQKQVTQQAITAVLDEMYKFQYGVFTLSWDSYHVADALAKVAQVAQQQDVSLEDLSLVCRPFVETFTGLFVDPIEQIKGSKPTTVLELTALLQSWCRAWQRYVQRTLYGGIGLNHAIAELRIQRHA